MLPAAIGDPNSSLLVLGCHAALCVAAHLLLGAPFGGAALLQSTSWVRERLAAAERLGEPTGEDARVAKHAVTFVCLLFAFGLVPGRTIFALVKHIFELGRVSEVRIELGLTVLRYAGRGLRSECPQDFRDVLAFVNEAATSVRDSPEGSAIVTRLDFLQRELADLKNNKVSFAVMDRFEQTRGWLTTTNLLGKKKIADYQLAVPFELLA